MKRKATSALEGETSRRSGRVRQDIKRFSEEQLIHASTNDDKLSKRLTTEVEVSGTVAPIPTRDKSTGRLIFKDYPSFQPNLTPKEILQRGSFGGTYFRRIYSSITRSTYEGVWKELPKDWLEGLDIKKTVSSENYDPKVNTYKVSCGGDLNM
jgi:hypothetical protein